jgi:hypothetical protein
LVSQVILIVKFNRKQKCKLLETGREVTNQNGTDTMMRILIFDDNNIANISNLAVVFINTSPKGKLDGNYAYLVRIFLYFNTSLFIDALFKKNIAEHFIDVKLDKSLLLTFSKLFKDVYQDSVASNSEVDSKKKLLNSQLCEATNRFSETLKSKIKTIDFKFFYIFKQFYS